MAILVIQHSKVSDLGHLGTALRRHGQRLRIVRVDLGQALPPDLDDVHGLVSLGGPQSANDAHAWVGQELELLRAAHAAQIPVLGICLGAQLLAKALGGEVARMAQPEIGWVTVKSASVGIEDALYAGVPWSQTVFAYHGEHVSKLPEGASLVLKGAACPVQAFRVGPWSYGIQYHPEWTRETILSEIDASTDAELAAAGTSRAALREATAEHYPTAQRFAERTFELANLMLFPATRQQSGLVSPADIHH
ncbi:MAG: type 1 glutamine amidotransferase [Phycisphaerales bacterium]